MIAASRLAVGSAVRIITNPMIKYAMAATFVTETNAIMVLHAPNSRSRFKGQRPPHDGRPPRQERPGTPSQTDRGVIRS